MKPNRLLPVFVAAVCAAGPRSVPSAGYRDWTAYGGGPESIRYSALSQINRENVSRLKVAWTYDTGDTFEGSEMQCNPVVVNGVLYATTPKLRVIALDAATGKLKWSFDPNEKIKNPGKSRNRGLTYWSDGKEERLYVAARHLLYSIDARTGKPVESFGAHGHIDLREGLGREPRTLTVGANTPGVVYKDLLIIGSIVPEDLPAAPGDIRAYELRTGKLRWSFHTIPHPGEFGYDTWPKDAWTYIGGVNNWCGLSVDEKRGLVFAPTGSAAFDFYGANRRGDNLFANTLLALDANTGKRIWHFQAVRHDIWDRDFPAPPSLVTVLRGGQPVDAVAEITKSGHVYVFDRVTGKPLFPIEERAYPASDMEDEMTAKTQPLPLKPPPFARQKLTEDMLTNRTPEAHKAALEQFRKLRSAGQFVPPSAGGTIIFPGLDGGGEWGGAAFDPETGRLYVNANEMAWILKLIPRPQGSATGGRGLYAQNCASCHKLNMRGSPPEFPSLAGIGDKLTEDEIHNAIRQGGGRMPGFGQLGEQNIKAITRFLMTGEDIEGGRQDPGLVHLKYGLDGYTRFTDPDGYPAIAPPWGTLNAIDLDRGEIAWQVPFGEFPALVEKGMRNTGSENYGGPVVTAGGLVFIGATNADRKFHAFDKTTGKLLWEAVLPAAGNATPAVYQVNGKQFVVIGAGGGKWGNPSGGTYVAFALPDQFGDRLRFH